MKLLLKMLLKKMLEKLCSLSTNCQKVFEKVEVFQPHNEAMETKQKSLHKPCPGLIYHSECKPAFLFQYLYYNKREKQYPLQTTRLQVWPN